MHFKSLSQWYLAQASRSDADALTPIELTYHIIAPINKSGILTLSSKIKRSRFYQRYIKTNSLVQWVMKWLRRSVFPIYIKYISHLLAKESRQWQPIVSLSQAGINVLQNRYELVEQSIIETTVPSVFPNQCQHYLGHEPHRYVFPNIVVSTVQNAMVYGGTNLIKTNDQILCHDLYHFSQDYTSEELHGHIVIHANSQCIRWILHDNEPETIPLAATFVDSCALNYAHWLTEVLPRIGLFCRDKRFDGIPIIVNSHLHANLKESLLRLTGNRGIIFIPIGRAVIVEELYVMSPTGYVPFEKRPGNLTPGASHGVFSPYALKALRDQLVNPLLIRTPNDFPKKIYLRRTSNIRKLINESDIEALLVENGFSIVEAERLSFIEQRLLFQHAEIIIGPTGAACANIIFCNPNANIAILMAIHKNMPYKYWLNISNAAGVKKINYILGKIVKNKALDFHGDYEINPNDLLNYLKSIEDLNIQSSETESKQKKQDSTHTTAVRIKNYREKIYRKYRTGCSSIAKTLKAGPSMLRKKIARTTWLNLVQLSTFSSRLSNNKWTIFDEVMVKTPNTAVFPDHVKDTLNLSHDHYLFPSVFVTTAQNVTLLGGSNLIRKENEVLCHDLYDFNCDYTSEELHKRMTIDSEKKRIRWLTRDDAPDSIPLGAIFLDSCTQNYTHWITEVLPRAYAFFSKSQFNDIPIIVADHLHPNLMESLLLLGNDRAIIKLPMEKELTVGQLYITSPTGYIPFDRRTRREGTVHSNGIFSSHALLSMRNYFIQMLALATPKQLPSKIFLKRNSHYRAMKNERLLQEELVSLGFTVIEPELHSFSEQVRMFSHAEVIVGTTGAAFANLIFCPPTTRVIICLSRHPDHCYGYWRNMAAAVGNDVTYVIGSIESHLHADFSIQIEDVIHAIEC